MRHYCAAAGCRARGSLNITPSVAVVTTSSEISYFDLSAPIISSTRISGAEAPAVIPIDPIAVRSPQGISAAFWTSIAFGQPERNATSTRRFEFELFGAPTTRITSQRLAMDFTAL